MQIGYVPASNAFAFIGDMDAFGANFGTAMPAVSCAFYHIGPKSDTAKDLLVRYRLPALAWTGQQTPQATVALNMLVSAVDIRPCQSVLRTVYRFWTIVSLYHPH